MLHSASCRLAAAGNCCAPASRPPRLCIATVTLLNLLRLAAAAAACRCRIPTPLNCSVFNALLFQVTGGGATPTPGCSLYSALLEGVQDSPAPSERCVATPPPQLLQTAALLQRGYHMPGIYSALLEGLADSPAPPTAAEAAASTPSGAAGAAAAAGAAGAAAA